MATPISHRLLNPEQAATYLAISPETLATWRCRGKGPNFLRLNKPDPRTGRVPARNIVRYSIDDLDKWISSLTETPGAAA